jgi:hypothetical protein
MSNYEAKLWAYQQDCPTGAKFVLVALTEFADQEFSCYPGQARLAAMTGQGERTVRRNLAALEDAGFIRRERRHSGEGYRTSDRYFLAVKLASGQFGQWPNTTDLPAKSGDLTGQIGQVIGSEQPEEHPDIRPSKAEVAAAFDEFWEIYPRRVGKRGAFGEFERALKRAPIEDILGGVKRYRDDPNRVDSFTKHPSTWLHQDCWSDDPLPARRDSNGRVDTTPGYYRKRS